MVVVEPGDEWTWKAVAVESIEQLDNLTVAFKLRDNIGFTDGLVRWLMMQNSPSNELIRQ